MLDSGESAFRRAALQVVEQGWIGLWPNALGGQVGGLAYLLAGWTRLFGDEAAGLRLLSGGLGLATLAVFYLFCRSLFGSRSANVGSLLMALSMWHLGYSRLAMPVMGLLLLELATAYLLVLSFREDRASSRHIRLMVPAGLCFGAGVYLHDAFFFFAAAVLLLWARELLAGQVPWDEIGRSARLFFIPALAVALPFFVLMATDLGGAAERSRAVAVTSSAEYQQLHGVPEQSRYVFSNITGTAWALFWRRGSESSRRLLDPATALLAVVGLAAGLRGWRERRHAFALAILAAAVVGVGLTREAGMNERLIVAAPAVFAYAGYGLHWVLVWMKGRVDRPATYTIVTALLAFVVASNLSGYFGDPGAVGP